MNVCVVAAVWAGRSPRGHSGGQRCWIQSLVLCRAELMKNDEERDTVTSLHLTRTPRLKKLNPIISLFVPHPAVARLPQQITLGCGWLDRLAQCLAQCLALIDEVNDLRVPGFCPPAATFHFNPSPVLVSECLLVLQKVPSEANSTVRNHGEGPY